jgi:Flp pilus assembly protein TadB
MSTGKTIKTRQTRYKRQITRARKSTRDVRREKEYRQEIEEPRRDRRQAMRGKSKDSQGFHVGFLLLLYVVAVVGGGTGRIFGRPVVGTLIDPSAGKWGGGGGQLAILKVPKSYQ